MLALALSYCQVMPAFLDFIFTFGDQEYPTDFFTGFRSENRLSAINRGLPIPELGRSGVGYQICYSLKSVEESKDPRRPWSIRQAAVYHSFDLETGRATWIMIKGNLRTKNGVVKATEDNDRPHLRSFGTLSQAFVSSLETHLILCEWAGEGWRWYINFLEQDLRGVTGEVLLATVDRPSSSDGTELRVALPPRSKTAPSLKRQWTKVSLSGKSYIHRVRRAVSFRSEMVSTTPSTTPTPTNASPVPPLQLVEEEFSFEKLQRTQHIGERVDETYLALKMNVNILSELRQYYRSMAKLKEFPNGLKHDCKTNISHFESRVSSVISDLKIQQSRLEALLRLLGDRKTLVGHIACNALMHGTNSGLGNQLYGILNFQNMETNKRLTQKLMCRRSKWRT
jgi:hypothetical protein